MELKRENLIDWGFDSSLLIVPYGIETLPAQFFPGSEGLLIVPYGIETIVTDKILDKLGRLLIVPYGIETG